MIIARSSEPSGATAMLCAAVRGAWSLLKGMAITFRYLSDPSSVVTQQYPENRETLRMFDRYRSRLEFVCDENGYYKCTACRICEEACPNASISIRSKKGALTGRTEVDKFFWRMDSCTFCNACVVVCPFSALKMSGNFESAVYDRRLLKFNIAPYAGPTAQVLLKTADHAQRARMITPRTPYGGDE